jgi:hypothetical protein
VTLVVRRGAELEGDVVLGRDAGLEGLALALRLAPSASGAPEQTLECRLVERGHFRFPPCEAGRAHLTIAYQEHVVAERDGIELVGGETTRLEPIDLTAVLHPIALTFELTSGEPWNGGHLEVREPDGKLSTFVFIGPSARVSFLALRPSVDLWAVGRGARITLFEHVLDGDRLTLPPAPSVRLCVPAGIHRLDPPLALMVRGALESAQEPEFETYADEDVQEAVVGEDRTAWLRLPWPGSYELEWFVRHLGTGVESVVQQPTAQMVEVTEASVVPLIEAELSRAALEGAIQEASE